MRSKCKRNKKTFNQFVTKKKEKVMDLKQQRINVELGEKESEGIYSNLALISHSPSEFIVDFARVMPGVQKTRVYARIVMTPAHARMLLSALEENIKKFEGQFGAIKIFGKEEKDKGIGFQAQKGE
jgi:hypothetical protein